jgi:hypothetical protein
MPDERSLFYLASVDDNDIPQRKSVSFRSGDPVRKHSQKVSKKHSALDHSTATQDQSHVRLLKQSSEAGTIITDFESRWEDFLSLRHLDNARRRIYLAAFFRLWKSRFSRCSIRRLEKQTADIESQLSSFASLHKPSARSIQSQQTSALLDRARRSISEMNSALGSSRSVRRFAAPESELPRGTSFSSISTSEDEIDEMHRYRSDRWRSVKPSGRHPDLSGSVSHGPLTEINRNSTHALDWNSGKWTHASSDADRDLNAWPSRDGRDSMSDGFVALTAVSSTPIEDNGSKAEIDIPETGNPLARDFAEQLRKVAELNSSISSIAPIAPVQEEEEEEEESTVGKLNRSEDFVDYARARDSGDAKWHSDSGIATCGPRDRLSRYSAADLAELKSRALRDTAGVCSFPTDLYDDVFTPGSSRREAYISSSRLSRIFSDLSTATV